jgi:hypothetical protein
MSAAVEPTVPGASTDRTPARAWAVFTTVLMWAVVLQAVSAGRILTGDEWARDVHRTGAHAMFVAAIVAAVVALVRLRHRAGGRRFALMLVAVGVGVYVQHGLGTAAAEGRDTLWIHVPLGVALVLLLAHVSHVARRVGGPA